MSFGRDSLETVVLTAKEQDLRPLAEESAEILDLDEPQRVSMENFLHDAWFFGIRSGHAVMVEGKMGTEDHSAAMPPIEAEFQQLMEKMAESLNLTVAATIGAWSYLGQAWVAGARFWEVEIAARLIEMNSDSIDEAMRWLEES
jgi:hypothetical protein